METSEIKKFDFGTAKGVVMITVVIVIVILIIVFGKQIGTFISGIGDSINNLFGFKTDPNVKAAQDQGLASNNTTAIDPNGPWGQSLYNENADSSTLDYSTLLSMSNSIYSAVNPIIPNFLDYPDGQQIIAQFKMCNNKVDVSNLVVVFYQEKNADLYDFITHNLGNNSNDNLLISQQILNYVQNLPKI